MANLTRRSLLKLAASAALTVGAGACASLPRITSSDRGRMRDLRYKDIVAGSFDYTKAEATPTICFGCTTHCGVIGWVADGRVHRIDGNPLDPNTQGKICSKAQGIVSATYYPERLLHPLKRVGRRGDGRRA